MKCSLFILIILLASCGQLMKGAEQPIAQFRDTNTFKTSCSGAAEDWGSCARKANRTCLNGYNIEEKNQDSQGAIRIMIFSCKNN